MVRIPFRHVALVASVLFALGYCPPPGLAQPKPEQLPTPKATLGQPAPATAELGLADLIQMALKSNPQLQQAGYDVAAAQGKTLQAGLYPNPTLSGTFDELGDRTGPGGINSFPQINQELVTAGKLKLDRAVAQKETDVAALVQQQRRIELITRVRKGYFRVLALQRRLEILNYLAKLTSSSLESAEKLQKAKQIAELDVLQFRVESSRILSKRDAAQRELVAAWQQLGAVIGVPNLPFSFLTGSLEAPLPEKAFEVFRAVMLERHPSIHAAYVQVDRAQVALKRAEVEKIPNVNIGAAYVRQNQNKSDDWMVQVSLPVPLFNRNQGNVQAAKAEVAKASAGVTRTQNELMEQLATAYGQYAAATKQATYYHSGILKDSVKAYQLSLQAFKGGQFEYLRVLTTQRAIAEANLEYLTILSQAWEAASEIAGLTLDETWLCDSPQAVAETKEDNAP